MTSGGFPLIGARVRIVDPATDVVLADTTTGFDGRYLVSWLGAGTYTAYAVAPGNATQFWFDAGFVDPTVTAPTPITLTATDTFRADVSFDFPTGGFGGWITGTTGPLANATATFTEATTGYSETAVVDPWGGFGLGYVPVGDYEVTVRWDETRAYRFPSTYTTGETGASIALEVPTGTGSIAGNVATDDAITLPTPERVLSDGPQPIPGASVVAIDSSTGLEVASALTDENGDYVIDGLLDADYLVYARAPGNTTPYWRVLGFDDPTLEPALTIDGANPAASGIDFAFPTGGFGGTITFAGGQPGGVDARFTQIGTGFSDIVPIDQSGGVGIGYIPTGEYEISVESNGEAFYTFPGTYVTGPLGLSISLDVPPPIAGTVTSPTGDPIAGASVFIQHPLFGQDGPFVTDVDGNYTVTSVTTGTFTLFVRAPGNSSEYWYGAGFVDPAVTAPTPIVLTSTGERPFVADFELPMGGFGGFITVAGSNLLSGTATFRQVGSDYAETVPLDQFGNFGLGYIPDGDYAITVDATVQSGESQVRRTYTFPETYTSPLSLSLEVPAATGVVSGQVLTGGIEVPGATVTVVDADTSAFVAEVRTGFDGRYSVLLDDGDYTASVRPNPTDTPFHFGSGYGLAAPGTVTLDGTNRTAEMSFDLPTGGFGGFVTGVTGPLLNASVSVRNIATEFRSYAIVDPTGNFGIGYLPVGDYEITVYQGYGGSYTFPDTYATGPNGLSVALTVPSMIGGFVVDGSGNPIEGARVALVNPTFRYDQLVTFTGANGGYAFNYLWPADYWVSVQLPGSDERFWYDTGYTDPSVVAPTTITIASYSDTNDVSFTIPSGGFDGSVTGETQPLRDATIRFDRLVGADFVAGTPVTVEADGTFVAGALASGEYQVTARFDVGSLYFREYVFPATVSTDGATFTTLSLVVPASEFVVTPGSVQGTVFTSAGPVADGARVRLLASGDREVASVLSEPDGTFVMTAAPGTYRLVASQGDESISAFGVLINEGGFTTRDLTMTTGIPVVRNEFVDSGNRPFTDGSVSDCSGNQNSPLVNGVYSILAPTSSDCTFSAGLWRNTDLGDGTTWSNRYENYNLNSTIPTIAGDYTWTIPTTSRHHPRHRRQRQRHSRQRRPRQHDQQPQRTIRIHHPRTRRHPRQHLEFNTNIDNPITGTHLLDVLQHPAIAVSVTLPDGVTLTQTINTTTGPTNIVFDTSNLSVVRNEFVDSGNRPFTDGSVSDCSGNQNSPLVNGVYSILAPTTVGLHVLRRPLAQHRPRRRHHLEQPLRELQPQLDHPDHRR